MHSTQRFSIANKRSMRVSLSKTQESYSSFKMTLPKIYSQWPSPSLHPTPTSGQCQKWLLHMLLLPRREPKLSFTGMFLCFQLIVIILILYCFLCSAMISFIPLLMIMLELLISNPWICVMCGQRTIWWSVRTKYSQIRIISMAGYWLWLWCLGPIMCWVMRFQVTERIGMRKISMRATMAMR